MFYYYFKYIERRKALIELEYIKGNLLMASSMCKKA
jgi:hypothetical protein